MIKVEESYSSAFKGLEKKKQAYKNGGNFHATSLRPQMLVELLLCLKIESFSIHLPTNQQGMGGHWDPNPTGDDLSTWPQGLVSLRL